jgi:hypothetical protein
MTEPSIQYAVDFLRANGWTCIPPADPDAAIPEPAVGQMWRSPKPRIEPRTIVRIGPWMGWDSSECVVFTVPSESHQLGLNPASWAAWVRKSGARPV